MDKKGLGLIAVLVVVGLIVIGSGILYYKLQTSATQPLPIQTQTRTQTSSQQSTAPNLSPLPSGASQNQGWKTYNNAAVGFSFQYPPTYEITGASEHPGTIVHIQGPTDQPELDVEFENFDYSKSIDPANIKIGTNVFSNFLVGASDDRYFFDLHGKELLFQFYFPQNKLSSGVSESTTQKFAQQILATLSLTTASKTKLQPSPGQAPVGWKTYSNSQYSIALNYPADFIAYDNLHDASNRFYAFFNNASSGPPHATPYDVYLDAGSVLLSIDLPSQSSPCDAGASNPLSELNFCTQENINGNPATVVISYQPAKSDPTYTKMSAVKSIIFQNQSFQYDLISMVTPVVPNASLQSIEEIQLSEKALASQIFDIDRIAATFSFPQQQPTKTAETPLLGTEPAAQQPSTPYVSFKINGSANSVSVAPGSNLNFTWTSNGVINCNANGQGSWSGSLPVSGSKTIIAPLAGGYSYQLICSTQDKTSVPSNGIVVTVR